MRQISAKLLVIFSVIALFPITSNGEERQVSQFIGPYYVAFNGSHFSNITEDFSDHCLEIQVFGPESAYRFKAFSWVNAREDLMIVIEEDFGGAEKVLRDGENATITFDPTWDTEVVDKRQRRIAGHEGTMTISQSEEGHTMGVGTFWLRSKTYCDDLTISKLARVQISCLDYTEEELDRILDTFEIERYLQPIKE